MTPNNTAKGTKPFSRSPSPSCKPNPFQLSLVPSRHNLLRCDWLQGVRGTSFGVECAVQEERGAGEVGIDELLGGPDAKTHNSFVAPFINPGVSRLASCCSTGCLLLSRVLSSVVPCFVSSCPKCSLSVLCHRSRCPMFWLLLSRVFFLVVPSMDINCCQVSCVLLFHALYRAVPWLFSHCPKFWPQLSYVLCRSVFCLGVPSSDSCCPASVLYLAFACLVSCYNRFRHFLSRASYFAAVACVLLFPALYPTVPCLVFCCGRVLFPYSSMLYFAVHVLYFAVLNVLGHVFCCSMSCMLLLRVLYVSYCSMSCILLFRVLYVIAPCLVFCCSVSCMSVTAPCLVFCCSVSPNSSISSILMFCVLYFIVSHLVLLFHVLYLTVPCLIFCCFVSCILLFTILYFDVLYLVFYCPVSRCSIVTCLLQLMFCLVKIPAFSLAVLRLVPYCPKYCLMMSYVLSHAIPSIVLCCPTSCLFSFVCLLSNVLSVNCKFAFWSLPLDILFPFGSLFLSSASVELRWKRYFTPSVNFLTVVTVVDLTNAVLSDLFRSSCAKTYTSLKTTLHTITSSLLLNSIFDPPSSQHYCPVVFTTLLHRPPTLHSTVFLSASIYSE